MKQTSSSPLSLRFRRWSRKAYSAFASIGRHVTIGCVSKSIADKSLSKQARVNELANGRQENECQKGKASFSNAEETPPDLCLAECLLTITKDGMRSLVQEVAHGIRGDRDGRVHLHTRQAFRKGHPFRKACFFMPDYHSIHVSFIQLKKQ